MSIADKLITIAENQEKIYNAGASTSNGYNDGYDKGYSEGESKGYTEGFTDGKNSAVNPFEYATQLNSLYNSVTFPNDYELTLVLPRVISFSSTFHGAKGLKKLTIKGNDEGNSLTCTYAFRCETVEIIDFSEFNAIIGVSTYMFNGASALKEIVGILDFSQCTEFNLSFSKCSALEKITVKPSTIFASINFANSPNLSGDTIKSIIDGLAVVETPQNLTLHASVFDLLTEEQLLTIQNKNWNVL